MGTYRSLAGRDQTGTHSVPNKPLQLKAGSLDFIGGFWGCGGLCVSEGLSETAPQLSFPGLTNTACCAWLSATDSTG
jgi:hypothetical protein